MPARTTQYRPTSVVLAALLVAAGLGSLTGQAFAQEPATEQVDEKAMSVLKRMSDYLAKETTVSFRARTFFDVVQETGIKLKMAREVDLVLKRPGHLYADTLDDAGASASIWYDGAKLTLWRRSANEFMELDFTGDTDQLLDELIDKHSFELPLADLVYSDVSKALGETILSSEYIGLRMVDGVQCHQISFESDGADWQMWIEADSTPVPRRFVIDYVTEDSKPQFMAQLDAWSLGGDVEDFRFKAVVPEGAEKQDFGADATAGQAPQ